MIRVARSSDTPAINNLRLRVRENVLSDPSWLTVEGTTRAITQEGRGWVWWEGDTLLGFSIALQEDPEIWALFVDPDAEGQGIGQALLTKAVEWLWQRGAPSIRLSTDPETRADRFYRRQGWQPTGHNDKGEVTFVLERPGSASG